MARVIVIGGIESTYRNAQVLHEIGEEIVMFYTRGPRSPGWEGVGMIDESRFPFASRVPRMQVDGSINDHVPEMRELRPDVIYSLGWQQIYSRELLNVCKVVGIHESLLPEGAGALPIANAILDGIPCTGCTLFWIDSGVDTGAIIGQVRGLIDSRTASATALYEESMRLRPDLLRMFVPQINAGTAPAIPQDFSRRTVYPQVESDRWPKDVVERARVYPYA